jgi:hypothetical protein
MEILTMKEVKERLLESDLGTATDSFNYILVLREVKNTKSKYQAYQVCVENGRKNIEKREIYMSEYDLLSDDIGKTYESYDENFIKDNEIVIALTDIEGF